MTEEPMNAGIGQPPSRSLRAAAVATLRDTDILHACPQKDRLIVMRDAVLLMLITAITIAVWTLTISTFSDADIQTACLIALPMAGIVYCLDASFVVSDLKLTGPLTPTSSRSSFLAKLSLLAIRLSVALGFSVATGTALTAVLFKDDLMVERAVDLQQNNAQITKAFEDKIAEIRRMAEASFLLVEPLRNQRLTMLAEERNQIGIVGDLKASMASFAAIMEAELTGQGRPAGKGRNFAEANTSHAMAAAKHAAAEAELAQIREQLAQNADLIKRADAKASAASATAERQITALLQEREAALMKPTGGILETMLGLEKLQRHPRYGHQVILTGWVAKGTLILLEMAFLLAKFLSPPSVYNLLLHERLVAAAGRSAARAQDGRFSALRRHRPLLRGLTPANTPLDFEPVR